jgi:hypothetical protein
MIAATALLPKPHPALRRAAWVAAAAAACVMAAPASAMTVAQWTFEAPTTPADVADAALYPVAIAAGTGSGVAGGSHASSLTDWTTPAGNGSFDSFSSNNWGAGDYYQFRVSTTGLEDVLLSWDQTSSGTGPRDFQLAYSTDGSSFTNFGSVYSVLANATPNPTWNTSTASALYGFNFDLSAVSAIDNQANVYFRLVQTGTFSAGGGTVALAGTSRVDNFMVMASPVPEPGSVAMLLAGLAAVGFVAGRRRAA